MRHTMSSPYYHESNGKAECYVGIVKRMLKKCDNIYDALLAYRSTPLCNSRHSSYELLFNCRMKDNVISLPVHYDGDEDESCDKTFKYLIQATRDLSLTKNASSGKRGEFFRILSSQISTMYFLMRDVLREGTAYILRMIKLLHILNLAHRSHCKEILNLARRSRCKEILNLARRSHCKEILNLSCKSLFVNSYRLNQKPILLIVVLLKSKRSPALM